VTRLYIGTELALIGGAYNHVPQGAPKEYGMKIISTRMHGVLDYLTAGALMVAPRALGWSAGVTGMMTGAALGTIGYSALTNYELGLARVLPMRAHLALDALSAALFCGGPLLFPDEQAHVRASLAGIGLFELAVTLLSQARPLWDSSQLVGAEPKNSHQLRRK
jgi:hypothetical protein